MVGYAAIILTPITIPEHGNTVKAVLVVVGRMDSLEVQAV